MGETSPLSVLYEARGIFYEYVGSTKLTEDLRGCPVTDKPLKITMKEAAPLPHPSERDVYIERFKVNINGAYFVFDMDKFYEEIVDKVYENQTVIWCKKVECYCTLFWLLGQLTRTLVKETHRQKRGTLF